ncbi:SRPBCC family protein [Jiangella asiatica]|uniref:Toxin-antitoxin system toxin subunit n=1 Tax=Jiangella asiatica TaxID=2530372 RepID=A0A4R5DGC4_9ACTN|nr:SRPBCC family protein [Jiangella asiatica]TDE09453.1 toxin-antitoxin system toxin subunit [Jiangella asiatica]
MTETLRTEGDRSVLRIERRFGHPRHQVWLAITEPARLSGWFPASVDLELRVGSEVRFDWGDGKGPSADGHVTEVDDGRILAFTWSGELLRFELRDDGDGCLMIFEHTFSDHYGAASFASGWVACLDALEEVADGVAVSHHHPSAEQHDHYVTLFGLDAGVADIDAERWLVRFERQLTRPAEVAWPLIEAAARDDGRRVVESDPPHVLEYASGATTGDGRVRWELREGTGHGARLVLTETGPAIRAGDGDAALTGWRSRLERFAAELRALPQP